MKLLKSAFWVVFVMLAAGVIAMVCFNATKNGQEETQAVIKSNIKRVARAYGKLEGASETRLRFGRPGRVEKVQAVEGQEVAMNDIVAELNPAEVKVQVQIAESALKEAEAKLTAAKISKPLESVRQLEEKLSQAADGIKAATARLEALRNPPAPPPAPAADIAQAQREIDRATRNLNLAESALKQLKSGPPKDEMEVAQKKVELANTEYEGAVKLLDDHKADSTTFNQRGVSRTQLQVNADNAKKRLELAQAEYDQARRGPRPDEIEIAEAKVALAKLEQEGAIANKNKLEKPPIPPPAPEAEIKAAEVALSQSRAAERLAKAALDEARKEPEQSDIDGAQAARDRAFQELKMRKLSLEGLMLRAPFDGLVVKRHVEPGSTISGFEDVVSVVDFSQKRVRAEFDIAWLKELKPGQTAGVTGRAFGKERLEGKVIEIGKVGGRSVGQDDPSVAKGGEIVEVVILLDSPKSEAQKQLHAVMRPGLRLDAEIVLETRENVLAAPKSYISQENGVEYVMVMEREAENPHRKKRNVTCGLRDDAFVEITNGLSEGDIVVKPKPHGL